jgi:hypothetical protein
MAALLTINKLTFKDAPDGKHVETVSCLAVSILAFLSSLTLSDPVSTRNGSSTRGSAVNHKSA